MEKTKHTGKEQRQDDELKRSEYLTQCKKECICLTMIQSGKEICAGTRWFWWGTGDRDVVEAR